MQRLSPLDAMFLHQDSPTVPRQVASLAILEPGSPALDYERLIHVINERIDLVPRYRQIARSIPGSLGTPVWIDDEHFDISLHVRRSALPRPGTTDALHELVGRLIARRLDLDRPLWELYLIEGLSGGRVALLFKAHQALVDGSETVDLAQVLLEETAHQRDIPHEEWNPRAEPNGAELVADTIGRNLRHPGEALRVTELNLSRFARRLPVIGADAQAPHSVLSTELGRHRRFASLAVSLDDFRLVR